MQKKKKEKDENINIFYSLFFSILPCRKLF